MRSTDSLIIHQDNNQDSRHCARHPDYNMDLIRFNHVISMINNLMGTGLVRILIRITATFGLRGDNSGFIMGTTWLGFNQGDILILIRWPLITIRIST